jgi:hypothetical protein
MDPVTSFPDGKRREYKKQVSGKKLQEGIPFVGNNARDKR